MRKFIADGDPKLKSIFESMLSQFQLSDEGDKSHIKWLEMIYV